MSETDAREIGRLLAAGEIVEVPLIKGAPVRALRGGPK